jgi:hypothetical protein
MYLDAMAMHGITITCFSGNKTNYIPKIVLDNLPCNLRYLNRNLLSGMRSAFYDEPDGSSTNLPNHSTQDDFGWQTCDILSLIINDFWFILTKILIARSARSG